jgi:methyl-accepting chemotaxis protein
MAPTTPLDQNSLGIDERSKTLARMNQMTQESAATAQEGASAGEELKQQPDSLNEGVLALGALTGAD